jgi:hypothetical protein
MVTYRHKWLHMPMQPISYTGQACNFNQRGQSPFNAWKIKPWLSWHRFFLEIDYIE